MIGAFTVGAPLRRGPLALYPLLDESDGGDRTTPAYLAGPEAAAGGLIAFAEKGDGDAATVPTLTVENLASVPVLVLEGETILGVKQNRTLNVSVLLPPRRVTEVPVSCVEAGRWGSARRAERSPHHAPARLRAAKVASVAASPASRVADQHRVWSDVDRYARGHGVAHAPTRALEDVHRERANDVAALLAATSPLPHQRGVVAAAGGDVLAIDVFDRRSTLDAYWQALLSGYLLDALLVTSARPHPPTDAVGALVNSLNVRTWRRTPAVGLGEEAHLADRDLAAIALVVEEVALHVAAFPVAPTVPRQPRRWFAPA